MYGTRATLREYVEMKKRLQKKKNHGKSVLPLL